MDQHFISTLNLDSDYFSNPKTYYFDNCRRSHLAFPDFSYMLQMGCSDRNNDHLDDHLRKNHISYIDSDFEKNAQLVIVVAV